MLWLATTTADLEATHLKYVLNFNIYPTLEFSTFRQTCVLDVRQSKFVVDTWKHPGISGSRY
ncbi:hypothetical protein K439DRAFT_1630645, partial [Ramaria rubella]